jgi:hypothetical protein
MSRGGRTDSGPREEEPIGIDSRQVFLAVFMTMLASILLILAIRYAFL